MAADQSAYLILDFMFSDGVSHVISSGARSLVAVLVFVADFVHDGLRMDRAKSIAGSGYL